MHYGFLTSVVVIGAFLATMLYLGPLGGELTRHSAPWLAGPGALFVFGIGLYVFAHPDSGGQLMRDGVKVCLLAVVEYVACWSVLVMLAKHVG